MGLARGMNLKFYTSVRKGLKVRKSEKVRQKSEKVSGVVPTILEVTGEKLVLGLIAPPSPSRPPSWVGLMFVYWIFSAYMFKSHALSGIRGKIKTSVDP